MPKTSPKPVDAEKIALMADRGQDISAHFTKQFTVVRPAVQRVNVDFTGPMLKELDREAETLHRHYRHPECPRGQENGCSWLTSRPEPMASQPERSGGRPSPSSSRMCLEQHLRLGTRRASVTGLS